MQKAPNGNELIKNVRIYNSMVIGIHNYYQIATQVNDSLMPIQYQLTQVERHRLKQFSLKLITNYPIKDKGLKPYLKSKMTRYINGYPLIPIGFIKTRTAFLPKNGVNKYTKEGRQIMHQEQRAVPNWKVQWIREHPVINERATIEFNDNRISLFIAQNGRCAITGEELILTEMDCHHKVLWSITKDDRYSNLIIVTRDAHRLIHATDLETIQGYLEYLKLNEEQLEKMNKLRLIIGKEIIK